MPEYHGLLCLTRRPGERVILRLEDGREITVLLMEVDRRANKARLGISAPPSVLIFREELRDTLGAPRRPATNGGRAAGTDGHPTAAQEKAAPPAASTTADDEDDHQELGGES